MLEDTRLVRSIEKLLVHDHLCLIYENQKEQFDAIIPFIKIGLGRGEKCIYIADDNTAGQVLNAMRADGIDVESALNKGALVIATKKETYLNKGYFDPDEMVQFLKVTTDSAKKDGFPALRVTGEMTWVLGKDPGSMRLMDYESKLNLFFPVNDCLAICQYNKNRFDPDIIKSVINTHPLVIAGGFVCRNFYYIPPEEFLNKEKGSLEVERLLSNLIDREKAEEKIKEAQKVLDRQYAEKSEIFNAIGNLTLLLDPEHNILAANRAAVTGLGKTEDELRGKKCYEFLHGTSQPPESCPMEKMLRSNSMETSEMVVETLNGIYLVSCTPVFDEKGNLEKVIHITTDITQRKKAEEQIRYQAALLANVNDAIVASDENYKLTAWNTAAESLYGWKAEEVLGQPGLEIIKTDYPGEDKERMLKDIKAMGRWRGEVTQVRKDGTRIPVEVSSIVLLDEKGRITGYISVNRDITGRKKIEEELKKHREHLEEMVKERTAQLNQKNEELERYNRLFVGRELWMIELKKKIAELEKKTESPGNTKGT